DCGVFINRNNFGERSGVIIEICKGHGLWFDRDQLGRAVRFVLAGGLEETKRRQLAELDRAIERRQLEAASDPAGGLGILGAPVGPSAQGFFDALAGLLHQLFK
ncbi:MAG: hypothetical protein ACYCWW_21265, partial [Deltaproteobacteria bacterium]